MQKSMRKAEKQAIGEILAAVVNFGSYGYEKAKNHLEGKFINGISYWDIVRHPANLGWNVLCGSKDEQDLHRKIEQMLSYIRFRSS